jgi:hypothetical protein
MMTQPISEAELREIRERAEVAASDWDMTDLHNVCELDIPRLLGEVERQAKEIELQKKLIRKWLPGLIPYLGSQLDDLKALEEAGKP